MKKVFVVFAVLALTMAMATVAAAEVTVDGSIDILMRSLENTGDFNAKASGTGDYQNTLERVRIGINAKHEGVKGRVQIENDYDVWGRYETAQGNSSSNVMVADTNSDGVADQSICVNTATGGLEPCAGSGTGLSQQPDPATQASTSASTDAGRLRLREAWIDFNLPFGIPGHIKVGHQLLQLGNGWFFRSGKYGSDAWILGFPGQNTFAIVNVKVAENKVTAADDTDAYVLLDTYKIDDKNSAGVYFARKVDRGAVDQNVGILDTIGLHYNGVVGPVNLAAELDIQTGKDTNKSVDPNTELKYSGNQIVVQATMPMDALTARATVARGTGNKPVDVGADEKNEGIQTLLDKDLHYTLCYEYFVKSAAGATNTGFMNTQAISVGADFKVNPMITVGADIWMLTANQKVAIADAAAEPSSAVGNEVDLKVNLKIADPLTWNTTVGYFMPGKAYDRMVAGEAKSADTVTAIQSVLSYKF